MPEPAPRLIEVPVLETGRLRLRGHRLEDFEPCAAMSAHPIVIRHTTGRALPPEEAWAKLLRNAGLWLLLGYGYWAVEEKATGEFVGQLGFADFKRDIEPPLKGIPEIGWILAPHVHGRGYATEAARVAITWADEHLGAQRTACVIHTGNDASIRVAEKCGYREFQRTQYKDHEVVMFERLRGEGALKSDPSRTEVRS